MRDEREKWDEQEKRKTQDCRNIEWRILHLLRIKPFAPFPRVLQVTLVILMSPSALQRFNQGPNHCTELLDTLSEFNGLLSVEVSDFFRDDHLGHYFTR